MNIKKSDVVEVMQLLVDKIREDAGDEFDVKILFTHGSFLGIGYYFNDGDVSDDGVVSDNIYGELKYANIVINPDICELKVYSTDINDLNFGEVDLKLWLEDIKKILVSGKKGKDKKASDYFIKMTDVSTVASAYVDTESRIKAKMLDDLLDRTDISFKK